MSFCQTCQRLSFRNILRLLKSDRSVDAEFQWFQLPSSVTTEPDRRPFISWHESVLELQASSVYCSLCSVIVSHMKNSYHFQTNFKSGDGRRLWLKTSVTQPHLTVYMGNMEPEVRLSGNYWYQTTPDSSVADYFTQHEIIQNPLHPFVLGKMERWVQACNDHHKDCLSSTEFEGPLPTRLLDLSTLPSKSDLDITQGDPRNLLEDSTLKLTENLPGCKGQYIALSYCWGKSLAYTTTTKNLQAHKQDGGIKYAQLPKTLQEAVFLTRYLGIQFLWADCLCIVQDDKADWEYEASRMADVYSDAYLSIAATRASHCGEGFLQARKAKDRHVVSFDEDDDCFDLYFYYNDLTMSPGSKESVIHAPLIMRTEEPLLSRVWCLQERLLPIRTLHFGSSQMYWECAEHFLEEDGYEETLQSCEEYSVERIANGLRSVIQAPFVKNRWKGQGIQSFNQAWQAWTRLVEEYTSRNMTYQSDKLPALSGVISALQKLTGDTCLAGIWNSWFLLGLLWRLQDPEWDNYVFIPKQPQRAHPWRAPSWSFASVEGVVLYELLENDPGRDICAELLECSVTPKGKNPLGEIVTGFARIRGPLASVTNVGHENTSVGRDCMLRMADDKLAKGSVYFDVDTHDSCDVLMITPHTGVAILPVNVEEGTYVRVGAVSVYRIFEPTNEPLQPSLPAFENRDLSLSAVLYPKPSIITLL